MLHLKQTLLKSYEKISDNLLESKETLTFYGVVPPNFQLVESLGLVLSSLILLVVTTAWLIVIFTLSLWLLIQLTLRKLIELLQSFVAPGSSVQYILCRLVDGTKNIILILKKLLITVWKKDGDLHQDSTSTYLATPGVPKASRNKKLEKAMGAPIDPDKLRKAGL